MYGLDIKLLNLMSFLELFEQPKIRKINKRPDKIFESKLILINYNNLLAEEHNLHV